MIKQRSKYKNLLALLLVFVMAIGTFIHYVPEMPEVEASDANARPVFDSRHQTGYAVTGVTSSDSTSTYENGVVNIAQNVTNTWFTTELPSDASYYARMYVNVGLTRTMSITFRGTGWDHYLKLQPNSTTPTNSTCVINYGGESKTITGCDMTDIRSAGVYVTYYSSPSGVKVWLDDVYLGEIEAQVTDSANPGIKQATGSATVSNIQLWTVEQMNPEPEPDPTPTGPVYDSALHTLYPVSAVTGGSSYADGVITIPANTTDTYFTSTLPADASYYARMYVNVGLTRTMSISFRGTGWNHYLQLKPNSTTPTNGTCTINYGGEQLTITGCDMSQIRNTGVYVTYYSSPSGVKVWLDDVYLGEVKAKVTESSNPGIKQVTGDATVSNIQLWTVNNLYDISEYRTADGDYTHPTKEDYVFGGWYTDTTYTTPIDEETCEGEFYAKWVAEEVLSVKAQLPAPTPVDANGRTIMRFVTTVDCDDYSEIGFDVSTKNQSKTYTDTRFFSSIQSRYDSIKVDYTPSGEFHETSKLFATIILTNLKATDDHLTKEFTIKPFWKTADGTKVYGVTRVLTIQEGIDAMNQAVNPYSL